MLKPLNAKPSTSPAIDRDIYLPVLFDVRDGALYIPETILADATAEGCASALWSGEYEVIDHATGHRLQHVAHVLRCQPAAGTAAVADAEIAEILSGISREEQATPKTQAFDWIEAHGCEVFADDEYRSERNDSARETARAA